MINQELLNYIARCRQEGQSADQIKSALLGNGWNENDVDTALAGHPTNGIPYPISLQPVSYKKNFGSLILLSLGVALPAAILFAINLWMKTSTDRHVPVTIVGLVVFILSLFCALWFALSLAFYISRIQDGMSAAVHSAFKRLPSYLWIIILIDLIVNFGYVLLIIPGIIFSIWFSFATFVLAQEDARGLNALLKSKEYVRGKWWPVFGRILALGAGVVVIIVIFAVLARIADTNLASALPFYILLMVAALILYYPFAMVTFYNLFAKIKNEKGIVPVPAGSRGVFITFAVLGLILPIIWSAAITSFVRSSLRGTPVQSVGPAYCVVTPINPCGDAPISTPIPENIQK